ncbi:MAG: ABC transporter permease [Chloroflexi bacterium]|nr:ABC transporter permease [Chloroflexota bacterium]
MAEPAGFAAQAALSAEGLAEGSRSSLWRDAMATLLANRLAVGGLIVILVLFLLAVFGPYLAPSDPLAQDLDVRFQKPSAAHWLGTDALGRDVFSRMLWGARTAVVVSLVSTILNTGIGIVLGAIAGYAGGKVDAFIVWLIDLARSMPYLLTAVVVSLTLRAPLARWMEKMYLATHNTMYRQTMWVDLLLMFAVLSLIQWPSTARGIRSQVLMVRSANYVLAARALGVPPSGILIRYVIPSIISPLAMAVTGSLGAGMVAESALSFLGVGVPLQMPSWGRMISDGLAYFRIAPHMLVGPGAFLGLASISFAFLADGVADAVDPRRWQ